MPPENQFQGLPSSDQNASQPSPITPPGQPVVTPEVPQTPPLMGAMPPKGSKKSIIIAAVVVLVLLIGGVSAYMLTKGNKSSSSKNSSGSSNTVSANSFTATSLSDYEKVCQGASASNASAYGGSAPHPIVMMQPSAVSGHYTQDSIAFKDSTWTPDYTKYPSIQLVGCFDRKSELASPKNCSLQDSNKKTVNIPLVPVTYTLTIYEAKSGKKVATKEVSGPATSCPFIAAYNPSNPKLYGDPDSAGTQTAVTEFVTKTL